MNREKSYSKGYYAGLAPEPRFDVVLKIASKIKGDCLLDIGCGDGTFTVLLKQAAEAGKIFGVEIAEEAVAKAKEKGIRATILDIDTNDLPFEDNYFDMIYCGELIEHLFNPDHLLKEIHRVLKPGGKCIISTPNLAGWPSRFALLLGYQPYPMAVSPEHESVGKFLIKSSEGQWGHIRVFTARALRELMLLHNFKIKNFIGVPVLINSPLPSLIRGSINTFDRIMSKVPSLSGRIIAVIEKE